MIVVEDLVKYYGAKPAIQNVSFTIRDGEIIGFLGLNGAGKTTILKMLSCMLMPSAGKVRINDFDLISDSFEIRKIIGLLPDRPPLYEEMKVASYLHFVAELRGMKSADIPGRIQEVVKITQLEDVMDYIISELSHGFQQRVGIAQAIMHKPAILIFDEPFSGLDPVQIVEMRQMIRGLKGDHTILLSSHMLPEISQTCDRILVIKDGEIVAHGTEEELSRKGSEAQVVELEVRGARDKIEAVLKQLKDSISQYTFVRESGDIKIVTVAMKKDVREKLSRDLVKADLGLLKLHRTDLELESLFLKLTAKEVRS